MRRFSTFRKPWGVVACLRLFSLLLLLGCSCPMSAHPSLQDTITDGAYRLYPLGVACRDGDLETVKRLLAESKDEPMAMGGECYEYDVLYAAVYYGQEGILRYALTRYKDINDRLYSDEYGLTLLTLACRLSNVKLARVLLEHGIHVDGCQGPEDACRVYPIMVAVERKDVEMVKLLLAYHADVDVEDSEQRTPLSLAKELGAKEIERLLLSYRRAM